MADVERNVVSTLLKLLLEQELITAMIYDQALDRVHKMENFPEFFEYRRRC